MEVAFLLFGMGEFYPLHRFLTGNHFWRFNQDLGSMQKDPSGHSLERTLDVLGVSSGSATH